MAAPIKFRIALARQWKLVRIAQTASLSLHAEALAVDNLLLIRCKRPQWCRG